MALILLQRALHTACTAEPGLPESMKSSEVVREDSSSSLVHLLAPESAPLPCVLGLAWWVESWLWPHSPLRTLERLLRSLSHTHGQEVPRACSCSGPTLQPHLPGPDRSDSFSALGPGAQQGGSGGSCASSGCLCCPPSTPPWEAITAFRRG